MRFNQTSRAHTNRRSHTQKHSETFCGGLRKHTEAKIMGKSNFVLNFVRSFKILEFFFGGVITSVFIYL